MRPPPCDHGDGRRRRGRGGLGRGRQINSERSDDDHGDGSFLGRASRGRPAARSRRPDRSAITTTNASAGRGRARRATERPPRNRRRNDHVRRDAIVVPRTGPARRRHSTISRSAPPAGDLIFADPSTSTTQFQQHHRQRRDEPAHRRQRRRHDRHRQRQRLDPHRHDPDGLGATANLNLTNASTWNVTGIRPHQPRRDQQLRRLRPADFRRRLHDADRHELSASVRDIIDERRARRDGLEGRSPRHQRRRGDRHDADHHQQFRRKRRLDDRRRHSDRHATNGGTIAAQRLRARERPDGRRLQVRARRDERRLVPRLLGADDAAGQVQSSLNSVAKAQQTQIVTNRILSSILLGATQQVSCSSCASGFGSVGSLAFGMQGRWNLRRR